MSNSKDWLSFDPDFVQRSLGSVKTMGYGNMNIFHRPVNTANSKTFPGVPVELPKANTDTDLFTSFRGFLILGRFLGVIPIAGTFKHSYKEWKFSLAGLINLCCILLLVFNVLLATADSGSIPKSSAKDIANSVGYPLFASWGFVTYSYFLLRRKRFVKMFEVWSKCHSTMRYTRPDRMLKWVIIIVTVVMLSSTILENAVLHMEYFVVFDRINGHDTKHGVEKNKNTPILQMYYFRAHPFWNKVFGYYPILAVLAFIAHKLILYGCNYVAVMMALFARSLYYRFRTLNKMGKEILLSPDKVGNYLPTEMDRQAWNEFAHNHESLCDVMSAMNKFFSPLIFAAYTIDIYYLCMQLFHTLDPGYIRDSIVHSIYSPWSFLHIILRLFLVSYCMANVNEMAHEAREIVRRCPEELYSFSIAKLDKRLNTGPPLGFSGLNCFTVTKPFMLNILQVIFTIEIVLLQGLTPP